MKKIIMMTILIIGLSVPAAMAQMMGDGSENSGGMMGGDQMMNQGMSSQQSMQNMDGQHMMNQDMMRNMNMTMMRMTETMQNMTQYMGKMNGSGNMNMQEMSKMMQEMSIHMNEMSGQMAEGRMDPELMKKIQKDMDKINNRLK